MVVTFFSDVTIFALAEMMIDLKVNDQFGQKLDKAATAVDDSDRMRKVSKRQISDGEETKTRIYLQVLESRAMQDEERMAKLEEELKEVKMRSIETLLLPTILPGVIRILR